MGLGGAGRNPRAALTDRRSAAYVAPSHAETLEGPTRKAPESMSMRESVETGQFRRTLLKVMTVQVITLVLLAILQLWFGR
jgi:hypothetical protein